MVKAKPVTPRIGLLPESRLSLGVRPFTYVAIDYFGPILVKVNQTTVKRWICLITCLTIRAVHVGVAYDLTTKSCISCIRRFICRRGSPKEIYCDNGRNFTGADRFLKDQIDRIEQDTATTFTNTEALYSTIISPHGRIVGAYGAFNQERLQQDDKLDDEGLLTVVVEAEGIVNSRPLTFLPLHSAEQEALTPNHFILGSSSGVVQPTTKLEESVYALNASRNLIQQRVSHFWRRWVLEYLPTLTRRTRWFGETKPIKNGDLVVVIDDSKRNDWVRGRIVEVTAGRDGIIRQALVQTSGGLFRRPVAKLAVLDVCSCM